MRFNHATCIRIVKKTILIIFGVFLYSNTFAQFDTQFYLPPLWRTSESTTNDPSTLVVTTPYATARVHIYTPDLTTYNQTFTVGKGNLLRLPLSTTLGQSNTINTPNKSRGLIITSDVPVQVVHRITSVNNKSMATLKGRVALGKDFWPGSQTRLINTKYGANDYHFLSFMAMEDGTKVTVESPFIMQGKTNKTITVTLNKHESYVMRSNLNATESISGVHVTSDKSIVLMSGAQHVRISGAGFDAADAGIDQIVPVDYIGNQYLVVRGAAVQTADYAIIIATQNNSIISIDGVIKKTLKKGEVYEYLLPGTSANVGEGHYIESNNDIYVYHVTGAGYDQGDDEVGMSILPSIDCNGSKYIEFSKFPTLGGQSIIIYVPTDALSTLKFNGQLYSTYQFIKVDNFASRPDWRTVVIQNQHILENNVVESEGYMHVGILIGSTTSGTYGFLSGFQEKVEVFEPIQGLATYGYVVDTLQSGESKDHCLNVSSCGKDHAITSVTKNLGTVKVAPANLPIKTCFNYIAPNGYSGIDTVRLVVSNEFGISGSVDVYFYIQYNFPKALDDAIELPRGGNSTLNVAANDTDLDGNLDISTVKVIKASTQAGVTAVANGNGGITINYNGAPLFQGKDSIQYIICDKTTGTPLCDSAWVRILVNGFPVAIADNIVLDEDKFVTVDVQANDSDPDNDVLITSITGNPKFGNAVVENNDSIKYVPLPNYFGNDTITYSVCDKFNQCTEAKVFIVVKPVNDAPIVDLDENNSTVPGLNYVTTFIEDSPAVSISDIDVKVSDVDNEFIATATITLTNPLDGVNEKLVKLVANASTAINASGTVATITGPLSHVNMAAAIRNVGYINNSNTPNITNRIVNVFVNDGSLSSDIAKATITVVPTNDPPVGGNATVTVDEDETYTFKVTDFTNNYSDPEGQAFIKIRLQSLPIKGTLFLSGIPVANGSIITSAQIPLLTYKGELNEFGSPYSTFTFKVSDGDKYSVSNYTITVNVLPVNDAPIAVDDYTTADFNEIITINVQANDSDVDGDLLITTIVSMPLGSVAIPISGDSILYTTGTSLTPRVDTIVYQICDAGGLCDTAKVFVKLPKSQLAPFLYDDVASVDEDNSILIDVLANDTDANGDSIFISKTINGPSNGVVNIISGKIEYTPNLNFNGTDEFSYIACDTNQFVASKCDTANVVVTVNPIDDKVIIVDGSDQPIDTILVTTTEDTPVRIKLNVLEVDGDVVDVINVIEGPKNGSISGLSNFDTTFTYSPNLNFHGIDTLKVIVCAIGKPTKCDTAVVIITVTPVNDAPVAVNDNSATDPGVAIYIDVQNNDFDVDGDVLITELISPLSTTLGDVLVINKDSISYTPKAGVYSGVDTLQYRICDSGGLCDTAFVFISIPKNQLAPFAFDDNAEVNEDSFVLVDVLANDIDANGDSIYISTINTNPINGIASIENGKVLYTPNPNYYGLDSLEYVVCDFPLVAISQCDTAKLIINVKPVDDNVVVVDTNGATIDTLYTTTLEDTPVVIQVKAIDVDRDTVDVVRIISGPTNGTVTGLNDKDTAITYSPNLNFNGVDTIVVVVCPLTSALRCDTLVIIVTVNSVNDAPVIVENTVAVDTINKQTQEDSPILVLLDVIDPDRDLVDIVEVINGPSNGYVTGIGTGDTSIIYNPNLNFNGSDTLVAIVCDNGVPVLCDTVSVVFTINPVNDNPDVEDSVRVFINKNDSVQVCLSATDVDGDVLDIKDVVGATIGEVSGIGTGDTCFTYNPNTNVTGVDTIKVIVCDNFGGCDTSVVIIVIVPTDNKTPIVTDILNVVTNEDEPLDVRINGTDPDGDVIDVTGVVSGPSNGIVTGLNNGDTTFTYSPNLDYNGVDTVLVLTCDIFGACDTTVVAITVLPVNDAPIIVDANQNSIEQLTVLMFRDTLTNIRLNVIDIDGDLVDVVDVLDGPKHGVVTGIGTGDTTFTYKSDVGYIGYDTLRAVVCDNQIPALCDTVLVIMVVSPLNNHNPVIIHQNVRTDTLYIQTDEDVPVLVKVTASDIDGNPVDVINVYDGPTNGLISGLSDGDTAFVYSPFINYNGQDTMRVVVCDNFLGCDTAVVIVTVIPVNDNPIIVDNNNTPIDSTIVKTNPNDTLDICLKVIDPDGDVVQLTTFCDPVNGTITGLEDNDLCFKYVPDNNFKGNDTICIKACDRFGGCDSLIITVVVGDGKTNLGPIAVDDTASTIKNTTVTIRVLDNDYDPNGDVLTVTSSDPNVVVNNDGTITFTPIVDFVGSTEVIYTICDPSSLCDQGTVLITVKNNTVIVTEGVTPNDDGKNDVLIIIGIEEYPDNHLQIYNRWGNLVYEVSNYDNNDENIAWGGSTNRGVGARGTLPSGTYFYLLELNGDEKQSLTGFIVLTRSNK